MAKLSPRHLHVYPAYDLGDVFTLQQAFPIFIIWNMSSIKWFPEAALILDIVRYIHTPKRVSIPNFE